MDAKVLRRAAEIVEQGWCQGAHAVDARGRRVEDYSGSAVAWCADGALLRAKRELDAQMTITHYERLLMPPDGNIARWNDAPERTADEVAAALRLAADRCDGASRSLRPAEATPAKDSARGAASPVERAQT